MKEVKKIFRIVVVEDSEFFNNLLTRQLRHYTEALALEKNCRFEVQSFTNASDCLRNINSETDIAFVDFYLGSGLTADDVLEKFKKRCKDCKVVIMSQVRNLKTSIMTMAKGALDFIFKDIHALPRACFLVEEIVDKKLRYRNN
ncbi:MAG TPA: response regulator [Bacteroidia bacterium]|jgi:DNA-binding NtrC family response regulator